MNVKRMCGNLLIPESRLRSAMELYPGKTREEVREILLREVVGKVKLGGCLAFVFLVFAFLLGTIKNTEEGIQRENPGGTGKTIRVQIEMEDGPQELLMEVGAREYETEKIEELYPAAEKYLEDVMRGENGTLSHVTKALYFPESLPNAGEIVEWTTDAPWLVTYTGEVLNMELSGPEQVLITAKVWYGSEFRCFSRIVIVHPAEFTAEEKEIREIQKELFVLEESSRTEERFVLPETVGGYPVFQTENRSRTGSMFFCFLALVVPILLYYGYFEKLETSKKERKEKAEHCYTEFVTKFSLLLAAGISVRQVVYRLADEYEKNYGMEHVLTEELKVSRQELEYGRSEIVVYETFGRRIGVLAYRRMASLLTQNVSKGVHGMRNLLLQEAKEVMAQEKANIRQKGEQAGTKLLLPMMGLLLLVFAILLVPAFQSF